MTWYERCLSRRGWRLWHNFFDFFNIFFAGFEIFRNFAH
jgi:hypothetical protein